MKMQNSETHFTSVPAFLSKLWALVDDTSTNDLIYWDVTGRSFHVSDQVRFSKEILPMYFKHNNMSSFIRQLNMYGFRKVMASDSLTLKGDREDLEFAHRCFIRGQEVLLEAIKRKTSTPGQSLPQMYRSDVGNIINEVSSLKQNIDSVTESLESLKLENDILWKEMIDLRQKHARQQELVSKLLQFFASIIHNDRAPIKRKLPLMIRNSKATPIKDQLTSQSMKDREPESILLAADLPDLSFATSPIWQPTNANVDTQNNVVVKQEPKFVLSRDFSREEMTKNLDSFQDSLDSLYELLNNNNNNNNNNQFNLETPVIEINALPDFMNANGADEDEGQAKKMKPNEQENITLNATGKELTHYIPPDDWLNLPQSSNSTDPLNDKDTFSDYIFDDDL